MPSVQPHSPKETMDRLMIVVAKLLDDDALKTTPFYIYGETYFNSPEGSSPMVRAYAGDFEVIPSRNINEDLCHVQQSMIVRIWGKSQGECLKYYRALIAGVNLLQNVSFGAEKISATSIIGSSGNWIESLEGDYGYALDFTFAYRHRMKHFGDSAFISKVLYEVNQEIEEEIEE